MPASHILATALVIQLLVNAPGKTADNGPSIKIPATHTGDLDRVLGSWLWLSSAPIATAI